MSKHCTGCKREISWGQKDCPFCGTSQSRIRQFLPYLTAVAVILGAAFWFGTLFLDQSISKIREQVQHEMSTQLEAERETIQNLNQQVADLRQQLAASDSELIKLKSQQSSSINEAQAENESLKNQLQTAQQEAERQKGRANWLGRENVKLKDEVDSLKQQLTELQQRQSQSLVPQISPPLSTTKEDDPQSSENLDDGL